MEVDSGIERKAEAPAAFKSDQAKSVQALPVQSAVKTAYRYTSKTSERPSKASSKGEKETPPASKMKKVPEQSIKKELKISDKDKPKEAIDKKEPKVLPDKKEKSLLTI